MEGQINSLQKKLGDKNNKDFNIISDRKRIEMKN